MSPEAVLDVFQSALDLLILLIMVILLPALAVGLVVSMFQAATQINEQTLSFIPKLLITLAVLSFAGPWMLSTLIEYTTQLMINIPMLLSGG